MSEGRGVAGVNLWSWGGEGRPLDHRWWVEGDPLTGDPPHEVQGKYAIFDADASTLKKIQASLDLGTPLRPVEQGEPWICNMCNFVRLLHP